ncbi:MAG: hypothetical protein EZS28_048738 [Streblomastix strix]|uniref:Uncharacterized protein n=1 Tax=Streblomastix strix TaxID=222440 RepID=A0A5J4TE37_9EUKA|nr:MAG: hypothetical protein EZS28_048738 [Streblomastix strix]
MSNVITTLGAATGSGSAITDKSIGGNTLAAAKNTTGRVRSIADIQSASYTKSEDDALLLLKADKTQLIDSYTKGEIDDLLNIKTNKGVSYSKSEIYARDEVYTKSETYSGDEVYTKGEDHALLLLKADKTQLIDSYTKSEDIALLLLKTDKILLIDSCTKGEIDELLNNKADNGVSYSKVKLMPETKSIQKVKMIHSYY